MFNIDIAAIQKASKEAMNSDAVKGPVVQHVFTETEFKKKLTSDMTLMDYFIESYDVSPSLIESIYGSLGSVAKEIDTNIHSKYGMDELSESEKLDIYKKQLETHMATFSKSLIKGNLLESEEITNLTTNFVNQDVNVDNIDMELVAKYAIFESELVNAVSNIIVPTLFQEAYNHRLSTTEEDYFVLFEDNFRTNYNSLMENIETLVVDHLAIDMFNESMEGDVKIDAQFKHASKLLKITN